MPGPCSRSTPVTSIVTALILILSASGALAGGEDEKATQAPLAITRATSEIRIDGVPDEPAWENALRLELPFEISPGDNLPAPVKTECFITYDDANFYFCVKAYEDDIQAIRSFLSDHDEVSPYDFAGVEIDTFNDDRRSYIFFVTPLGVQYDGTRDDLGEGEDESWDAIWDAAGRITEYGYAVEAAIPFNQIRFQRTDGSQVWGISCVRVHPRDRRRILFSQRYDRNINGWVRQFTKIEGFGGISPGRNIQITPTVTAVRTDARSELPSGELEEVNSEAEVGLTASYGVTSNLMLSATVNPDFSQVEADALKLDINEPFALYFEEKRPFFTEGQDIFNTSIDAVYTRTLRDPIWGLKLAGKEGSNTIGAYVVQDDITNLIFPGLDGSSATSLAMESTATVLRYRRDISGRNSLGVLLTDREGDDYHNRLVGVDGKFRITNTDSVSVQAIGSYTDYPDAVAAEYGQPLDEFSDLSWEIYYTHETRNYYFYFENRARGADFRTDLGYVPQVDYDRYEIGGGYTWIGDNDDWYSNIQVRGNWDKTLRKNGDLFEEEWEAAFNIDSIMQSSWQFGLGTRKRVYNFVEFDQDFYAAYFEIKPAGNLYTFCYLSYDDAIDYSHARAGKRWIAEPYVRLNLGRHLYLRLDHLMERLTVEGGRLYLANASDLIVRYQFNVRTFVRAIIQFSDIRRDADLYAFEVDPQSRNLFTQLLFSYKINPQTVLFLGYSDNHFGTQDFGLAQTDRTFFVKIGYAWVL